MQMWHAVRYTTPKPLIDVRGRHMIEWVIENVRPINKEVPTQTPSHPSPRRAAPARHTHSDSDRDLSSPLTRRTCGKLRVADRRRLLFQTEFRYVFVVRTAHRVEHNLDQVSAPPPV